jgi:hypothetical protein
MKALNIIEQINTDELENKKDVSRKEALTKGWSFGLKAALAAIPVAILELGSSKAKAAAPSNADIVAVLNFALTLEYLEADFYIQGLNSGVIPGSDLAVFQQISKHESAHVTTLKNTIVSLQGTPINEPTFDFTAGGTYADVFTNYQTFLAVSNALEDTGVRAYKGQAPNLLGAGAVLTAALDIHSVEARHASEVRRIRGLKGWISNATGTPAAVYAGEDNVTQGGVNVTTVTTAPGISVTEAFDEPLTQAQVIAIAGSFIVSYN